MALPSRLRRLATSWMPLAIGALLIYSGVSKLNEGSSASEFVEALLGVADGNPWIRTISVVEILLGIGLVSRPTDSRVAGLCATLFAVFAVTHVAALVYFEEPLDCGCGLATAATEGRPILMLGINAVLVACCLAILSRPNTVSAATTPLHATEKAP